jgi:hypothetical protein
MSKAKAILFSRMINDCFALLPIANVLQRIGLD